MKNFFGLWAVFFIICLIVISLFLPLIVGNFWVALAGVSFFLSLLSSGFIALYSKMEALEKRLALLENDKEPTSGE